MSLIYHTTTQGRNISIRELQRIFVNIPAMRKFLVGGVFLLTLNLVGISQTCFENAKEDKPQMSEAMRKTYETQLAEARARFEEMPHNAEAMIWLGRRTAYIGNYRESIRIFTKGIEKNQSDARFYRHRGHRFITLRCFDDAIIDLKKADELTFGKSDEIEPDGLPNKRNTPTSTLQTNIWYHLGLAYYLKGDFDRSAAAFMGCFNRAKNPDMQVAAAHWVYMSVRRYNKEKDAKRFINREIKDGLDIIENDDYYKLVKLYQGKVKAEVLLKEIGSNANTLGNASMGYGLGNWFLYNGEKEEATRIFRQITAGDQWASFGYIAAEAELSRRKHDG